MLTEKAPAKLNLTLEVLGRRPDGFHEIRSIMQAIDLCDYLYFNEAAGISISCDMPGWSAEMSLAAKAVEIVKAESGVSGGISIKLEKRIPLLSGLGGDSSNAAAVLRGLNQIWRLAWAEEKMAEVAALLGSDVAFFLRGGTALAEGRGEKLSPLPAPPERWVVLVVPELEGLPGKTGRMYAALKPEHFTDGAITTAAAGALRRGALTGEMLFNTFENIAFDVFTGLSVYKKHLLKLGARRVHLAGSGPALFAVFSDRAAAGNFHGSCEAQGMETYMASTYLQ